MIINQRGAGNGASTLETNMDALNVKTFDLEFDVDPLFKKTSALFDEGGAAGLLLNNIGVNAACQLLFDSSDPAFAVIEGSFVSTLFPVCVCVCVCVCVIQNS